MSLSGGLHFQLFSLNNSFSAEPRLGLRWDYAGGRSLSLGYGLHSQTLPVTVYFRDTRMPDSSFRRLNEDLEMLKSHHLVLGHDWSLNEVVRFKAEAYYQYITSAAVNDHEQDYFSILNVGADFGFGTPDTLKSTGTGHNLGLELTFEHFLNKGLYYLATVSVYDSRYRGSDDILRNTAFNGNYTVNLLLGKEFVLNSGKSKGKRNTLGFDVKTTWTGGQRYVPFYTEPDPNTGNTTYRRIFEEDKAYEERYSDYFRTDLKLTWRRNGKKITQEFGVDIQNLFNTENVYARDFNRKTGEKTYIYQMRMLVIPQYRITF